MSSNSSELVGDENPRTAHAVASLAAFVGNDRQRAASSSSLIAKTIAEVFDIASDWLPLGVLPAMMAASRELHNNLDCSIAWRRRCVAQWADKTYIMEHCRQLSSTGNSRLALRESLADLKRTVITEEEICAMVWRFRFKQGAGKAWTKNDEWWNGGSATLRRFSTSGEMLKPGELPGSWEPMHANGKPVRWRFASWVPQWSAQLQPISVPVQWGCRVQTGHEIGQFPTALVWRHPLNWGFVLEGPWTIMTSFEMPERHEDSRGHLAGARLRNNPKQAALEVDLYRADICVPEEPPKPEHFFARESSDGQVEFFLQTQDPEFHHSDDSGLSSGDEIERNDSEGSEEDHEGGESEAEEDSDEEEDGINIDECELSE